MPEEMSSTKEKILFDTNELVIALNTQVAVLTTSNDALKKTVENYMEKMDRHMDKMDERDATLDQRIVILRTDFTKEQGRTDTLRRDVDDLRNKSNILDLISMAFTAIVGTIMYFLFGKQP